MRQIIFTTVFLATCLMFKVSDAQLRLVAEAHYQNNPVNFELMDSTMYMNSGATKSNIGKFNIAEYDLMYDSAVVYDKTTLDKKIGQAFDGNGLLTERITYEANGDKDARIELTYISNKPDTVFYQTWSSFGGGRWSTRSKIAYQWNGNNKTKATRMELRRVSGNWVWREDYQDTWTYNGSGQVTEYIHTEWDNGQSAFINMTKQTTTYSGGMVSTVQNEDWDPINNGWVIKDKDTYTYSGSKLQSIEKEFYSGGSWFKSRKDDYIYNSGSQYADTVIEQLWDGVGGAYANSRRLGYRYTTSGKVAYRQTEQWDGTKWTEQQNQEMKDYYYYDFSNSVNEVANTNNGIKVYPSPASNNINVTIDGKATDANISIIDITGKTLKTVKANTANTINISVSELPAGSYILNIDNGNEVRTERFVISK